MAFWIIPIVWLVATAALALSVYVLRLFAMPRRYQLFFDGLNLVVVLLSAVAVSVSAHATLRQEFATGIPVFITIFSAGRFLMLRTWLLTEGAHRLRDHILETRFPDVAKQRPRLSRRILRERNRDRE
jgi:hypothetical protein